MQQPIKINFLAAADGTALTKQYTREDDSNTVTNPYPNVRNFSSFEYEISNLSDWFSALEAHSDLGHCFLKGQLDQKLTNESRAGHTHPNTLTQTVLLDLDFNEGFRNVEDFLHQLDNKFIDVSYIQQHSNSAGITGAKGLRVHLGFLMDKAVDPAVLKLWLQHKNLTVPALRKLVKLTANGMSLKYPLDITTCQNDKIIYIARPTCIGFDDPLADERTTIVTHAKEELDGKFEFINPQAVQDLVDELVAELRESQGLKKKTCKFNKVGSQQVLLNPDIAVVTGIKVGRDFTYLNLNEGDSWGYFHSTTKPNLLFNFKGEPNVRLRDIVPEYVKTLNVEVGGQELVPMVFRDRARDQYYNIVYDPNKKDIDSLDPVGSRPRMVDFMKQFNKEMPDPIEDWRVEFDPTTLEVFDTRHNWINSFKPSDYMKKDWEKAANVIPYVIDRIITSICVDKEYKEFFLNWLAYLYQTRKKSGVCPIFHGVQGTGKGLLHEKILMPLFGEPHTPKVTTVQIKDPFNGWSEKACVAVWDEADQNEMFSGGVYDKVKNLVTEDHTPLRLMRQNLIMVKSFINLVVNTNHPYPFPLDHGDRRFSPAPPQLNQLVISAGEVDAIEDELDMFAAFLHNYEINTYNATHVLMNQAREDMILGSANTVDTFFHALRDGNMDYFLSFLRDSAGITPEPLYNDYVGTLRRWCESMDNTTGENFVTRDEARHVYSYIIKEFKSPAKFKKMGDKFHFEDKRGMVLGKQLRGWVVKWELKDRAIMDAFLNPATVENVVNLAS